VHRIPDLNPIDSGRLAASAPVDVASVKGWTTILAALNANRLHG
jgi:hypothetical protein